MMASLKSGQDARDAATRDQREGRHPSFHTMWIFLLTVAQEVTDPDGRLSIWTSLQRVKRIKGLAIVFCDTQSRDPEFPDRVGPYSMK